MAALTKTDIKNGYETVLLGLSYLGGPIGQVESSVADTSDEALTRAIFDNVASNPQRALLEIHVLGGRSITQAQGRYEVRTDHQPVIEVYRAFMLDGTTFTHMPQAWDDADAHFTYIEDALIRHSNIACGTNNRGVQVAAVQQDYDPRVTVQRGRFHCFKATFRMTLINQGKETT